MDKNVQNGIADTFQQEYLDVPADRAAEYNCFPLSFAQERLWFLDQAVPCGSAYNIAGTVRLKGELDRRVLEQGLQEIVRRHETLRTSFLTIEGRPFQRIHERVDFCLREEDLRDSGSAKVLEQRLARALESEAGWRFNLSKPELVRMNLLRIGDQEYVLTLVMHHIIADGWSIGVLIRELKELYEAFSSGRPTPLAELEIQYVDYSAWQRELFESGELKEGLEYWKQQLDGAPALLEILPDYPRKTKRSYLGGSVQVPMSRELSIKLKDLSLQSGATLYMVLLAGFQAVLWRYTGQKDVVVGSPVAERPQVETEKLIGLFVNFVARRTQVDPNNNFLTLLQAVRQSVLKGQPCQYVPFEKVVEALDQKRIFAQMPVVQVAFAWQSGLVKTISLGRAIGKTQGIETGTAKFDLTLMLEEDNGEVQGCLEYSTDLFCSHTARQIAAHYVRLLEEAAAHPELPIANLRWMSEDEQDQLIAWNRTRAPYPGEKSITRLFEEVAGARGDAVAVIWKAEELGYAALNAKANQLAYYLKSLGVGPEVMVGISMERSPAMMIGILGILKAGGCYVPLDPNYPRERLQFMLEDAGIRVLLTEEKLRGRLPEAAATTVCLEQAGKLIDLQSTANLESSAHAENLAYVMYTSGSTGRPKGVGITHRNIVRLVRNTEYAEFGDSETFLQFAPISFDASTFEIWGALLNGGRLALFSGNVHSLEYLEQNLSRHAVTTLWLTAGLFHLVAEEQIDSLRGVRQLLAGGDVLQPAAVKRVLDLLPDCRLINGYGPTEGTTFSCCYSVERSEEIRTSVPIGRAIANTQAYVLDEWMEPVPAGVPGELYIGGEGLARGYWNQPELTAERFVPDGVSGEAGRRLYRTGDRARNLHDGNIEFLGRADSQVKIRGFRVEVEEIEAVLRQEPGVRHCAVLVRNGTSGEKRLVAYIVPQHQASPGNSTQLREYLKGKLPEYMVPAVFQWLEQMPLSPNGKLDRKSLPEPETSEIENTHSDDSPLTVIEERVRAVWLSVLDIGEIHRGDNFFELGGHSLAASRAVLELRRAFKCNIPVSTIFEFPTLQALSGQIESLVHQGPSPVPAVSRKAGRSNLLPLSPAQEGLWFLAQMMPSHVYNIAGVIQLNGELDKTALERSLQEIVRRHEVLRTGFVEADGQPMQKIYPEADLRLEQTDLRQSDTSEDAEDLLRRALREEATRQFELSRPGLLRARLFQASEDHHVLVLVMHHIIADGWSVGLTIAELTSLYGAFSQGRPSTLPELEVQYGDHAAWHHELMSSEALQTGLEFWKKELAGVPALLELPADYSRTPSPSYSGASHGLQFDGDLSREVAMMGCREGLTPYVLLLAAFHILLSRCSGTCDIVVGSPMEARLPENEKLIGLFVNLVALRAQVDEADSFIHFARKVRQTVQQAKAYQDIPFGKVVHKLAAGRVLSHMPLVQVVFAWQAGLPGTLRLGKADGIVLPLDSGTSKFDLTLTMEMEEGGQIRGSIEYSTEIFRLDTVRRMADGYVRLVRSALAAPDAAIRQMKLMSDEEEVQVQTWSSGTTAAAPASTVLELFAAQVREHPESTAVECMGTRLSFVQLDRRANQLARHLRRKGAGEESVVGICMSRTAEIVVAMLGVLKAGAAYVSMDPSYPDERLQYMLEDAEVRVLCTEEQMLARVRDINCATIIAGEENDIFASTDAPDFLTATARETPAYIIYTSGSTGRPKGVQVTHRGLHNLCSWHRRTFVLGPGDRTTQIASLGFDASVWEIWSSLTAGATLCFVPEEIRTSPAELQGWLLAQKINAAFLPTPLAEELIRLPWPEHSSLRTLLTGGDRLHQVPGSRLPFSLVNNYGPTECAVVATSGVVEVPQPDKSLSIGKAIDNAQVYVLDRDLRTVPCGVAGEVYIGGEGLARGYWRRPDLTAERFVPNPLHGAVGARLYRTGDRARYLSNGQLEFLGRLDHQVKLRGHRIELEEIASVLRRFDGVRDALVAVLGSPEQSTERLVAYVAHDDAPVTQSQLLQFSRQQLPPYMVPAAFVFLDRLPLNASGKVDRKALPAPETNAVEPVGGGLPLTPVEELVAGVWKNVLNAASIFRGSNFFELGGHSLLATKMIAQLRQLFNPDLPLRLAFEFPVLADLAAQIEACKPQASQFQAIPHISRQNGLPLSPAQRRLWLLDQIIPNQSTYNIPGAMRLLGTLNEEALEQSLREIVRRHEVLRTSFVQSNRTPVQQVHDTVDFKLQRTDLKRMTGGAVDGETVMRAIEEEILRPFVLSDPGLIRARLLHLAEDHHVLVVVMHHIVADGWSVGILIHELTQLYGARCQERPSPLPELKIQYADYAAWQNSLAGSERLQHDLEYWKKQLSGPLPVSDLPTDYPRPPMQRFTGATEEWRLSRKLTADLKDMGQKHGGTLFMTLLSALQILLSRYTSQKDVVVGSPIANRPRTELQALIGFFINMIVLRADLSDDPTVEQALRRTREMCLQAYAHQDLPFEKLVEELEPERDLGRNPLFQVMFAFENAPDEFLQFPGLEVSLVPLQDKTAKFDLSFVMADRSDGIHGTVQYCTDLFARETIRQLIEHYEQILIEIVCDPAKNISKLSLLTAKERNLWKIRNQTETEWSTDENIVKRIERQAESAPAAIAVEFEGQELTCEELNQRANQLARYLRKQGAGADDRIVLCMERSLEMVIGILGVMKAGCAYVPIDPGYPEDRVKYMLEDAGSRIVLTQQKVHHRLPGLVAEGVRWISLDSQWDQIARERTDNPGLEIDGASLAYMIYTSGSTGLPKGAMNTHSGLWNRLLWMQQEYGLTPEDRVLQKTPFSFDVSVWEFLWPLMEGARLVVARPEGHRDAGYLVQKLRESQITTLHFVPSMLRAFAQAEGVEKCTSLRRVIVSGEALPPDLVDQWERRHGAGLHNLYGPTEASIDVSFWPCREKRPWGIPIGRPIANTQLYVVDDQGELAPLGVVGELYIGGVGLSRGYWNRAALTAEKFVPDGFSGKPGSRLYRTGDRARCRLDGVLEYLGRNDEQVKIRGYRIELGEIESALRQQSEIAEAAVLVKEERTVNKRLVAYLVPAKAGDRHSPEWLEKLQGRLKKKLPEYMVPTAWVELERLPLNPNGKLDRKALLKIETPRNQVKSGLNFPQSDTEKIIAAVWKSVLGVDEIGVEENFFDIGGHSLLLAEVHRGLQEKFDASLQLVELFQHPTIRGLAAHLKDTQKTNIAVIDTKTVASLPTARTEVAIIGMACRFPGAGNTDEFWANLQAGVESISEFSDEELRLAGVDEELLSSPNYVKRGAVLKDIEWFDARFFNFSAREAEMTDPQHRILLECAWEALETAGYNADIYRGKIGVYAGSFASTYFMHLYSNPEVMKSGDGFSLFFANGNDFLATRVSYKLNLTGPSMTLQCGCSTSLMAIHTACKALANGECDMALAGGVAVKTPQKAGHEYQEGGIFSPDGHCRSFDAQAQGTVGGNGSGVVVLKRLEDALRDRDHIYAVVKGSAANNDGADKVGYTAPGVNGQREAILQAQRAAGVAPETITYVEAHGTGTLLGDPVEVTALTQAFRAHTAARGFCAIGSVKSNVGHLDTAAGVAGVIKTALALQQKQVPPTLHFERPNPRIDFESSPFYVNTQLMPWAAGSAPRRAAVSAFGIGGTNVHVIMEEAPISQPASSQRPWQLLLLSAKSGSALDKATENLSAWMRQNASASLADAAHTLQVGRRPFQRRRFVVARDLPDAAEILNSKDEKRLFSSNADKARRVAFMFPGQGSQYVNMGRELYEQEPLFRAEIDYCAQVLQTHLGFDLREVLYPSSEKLAWAQAEINETRTTQPALYATEYALAKLWMSWGILPDSMLGHSIGEYVAACLAGVFSLEDALSLVATRGRLMHRCACGGMLAVVAPEEEIQPFLKNHEVDIAAINGPRACVLAGPITVLDQLEKQLSERNVLFRRLNSSHAFHSRMMEPVIKEFTDEVRKFKLSPPRMRYLSNVTGDWITGEQATDPEYYGRQIRNAVQFARGVLRLIEDNDYLTLEVGPGHSASTSVRQTAPKSALPVILNSLADSQVRRSEQEHLLHVLGNLWLNGIRVDWQTFAASEERNRVALPTYPFERQRYWIDGSVSTSQGGTARLNTTRQEIKDWFYVPCWKAGLPVTTRKSLADKAQLLLFADSQRFSQKLRAHLETAGYEVTTVARGEEFVGSAADNYIIRGNQRTDYDALLSELMRQGRFPERIVHMWNVSACETGTDPGHECHIETSFYSLLYLAQAIQLQNSGTPVTCVVVASGLHEITGNEELVPGKAMLLGMSKSAARELPNVSWVNVDVEFPIAGRNERFVLEHMVAEVVSGQPSSVVSYRGAKRWVQSYERVQLEAAASGVPDLLKPSGVYVIAGGLIGAGWAIAEWLATTLKASLVLTSNLSFPAPEQWDEILAGADCDKQVADRIRALRSWESNGARILVCNTDVTNRDKVLELKSDVNSRFGDVNGVIFTPAAGSGAPFASVAPDKAHEDLLEKIRGAKVLDEVFTGEHLDFLMLCSSLNSVTGEVGQIVSAAGDAFLDAFADRSFFEDHTLRLSVNWDALEGSPGRTTANIIQHIEIAEVFCRILSARVGARVAVSVRDLEAVAQSHVVEQAGTATPDRMYSRPDLDKPMVAPTNPTETLLVQIWTEILGISPIGTNDNFFELGGDSLIALKLIALAREGGFEISVEQLFKFSTIQELATVVSLVQDTPDAEPQSIQPVLRLSDLAKIAPVISAAEDYYRLSHMQEGMLFHTLLTPETSPYFEQMVFKIRGRIDMEHFESAWRRVSGEYECLRTAFYWKDLEHPVQVVHREADLPIHFSDWIGRSAIDQDASFEQFLKDDRSRAFDLAQAPLVRLNIFQLGERDLRAVLSYHHLLMDAWSLNLVLRAVMFYYVAYCDGSDASLERSRPYRDYITWLQQQDLGSAEAFWRRELEGFHARSLIASAFPATTAREAEQYGTLNDYLSKETSSQLRAFSSKYQVTLNTVMEGAWALLLARLTGLKDVVFGTTVSGRPAELKGVEDIAGLFINTLPLRVTMVEGEPVSAWLKRLQKDQQATLKYQYSPLARVQSWSELKPGSSLFDSLFGFENIPQVGVKPSREQEQIDFEFDLIERTGYPLTVLVQPDERISVKFIYDQFHFNDGQIKGLLAHYQTVLDELMNDGARAVTELPLAGVLRPRRKTAPLSCMQHRLWSDYQSGEGKMRHTMSVALKFSGNLDQKAIAESINEVVRRHDILRATFPLQNGSPVQKIAAEFQIRLEPLDVSGTPADQRDAEIQKQIEVETHSRFDLSNGPLVRARMLYFHEQEHALVLVLHTMVADSWSGAVLGEEITRIYEAYSQGLPNPLLEPSVQYPDFAVRQQEWLTGKGIQTQMEYWRRQLRGMLDVKLPVEQSETTGSGSAVERESCELPPKVARKLGQLTLPGHNLFVMLLGAYTLALARTAGQQDVTIVSVDGRDSAEKHAMIGPFMTQCALRTGFTDNPSFRELLERVHNTMSEARQNQDVPFDRMFEELWPDAKGASTTAPTIILQMPPPDRWVLPQLIVQMLTVQEPLVATDFTLQAEEIREALRISIAYNPGKFSAATVRAFLHFYRALLTVAAENEEMLDLPVRELLAAAERKVLVLLREASAVSTGLLARRRQGLSISTM